MMKLSQFLKLLTGSALSGLLCCDVCAQETLVTNVSRFEIPFEIDIPAGEAPRGFAVLFSSIDNGATWEKLQTVPAAQQSFQFAAPRDGTYAFAVRMTDAVGRLQSDIVGSRPELQVTVDTTAPELRLELFEVSPGQVVLNWQTTDSAAKLATLTLEYADGQDGRWIPIDCNASATGQTSLRVTPGSVVSVRGTLRDAAGNEGSQSTQLVLKPVATSTMSSGPIGIPTPRPVHNPSPLGPSPFTAGSTAQNFSGLQTGPQSGQVMAVPQSGHAMPVSPSVKMMTSVGADATIVPPTSGGGFGSSAVPLHRNTGFEIPQQPQQPPLPPRASPPVTPSGILSAETDSTLVNSQVFDLVYQVDDVGPSGVGAVDVYITENGGQQWFRYGQDPDLRSPFQVDVRGEGTFGFTVRVRNGLGFSDPPPQAGEVPSIVVHVDQTAPAVHLATPVVQADGSGVVNFQWQVTERWPAPSPIRLEYSVTAEGPWTPAFDWQSDIGSYQWPIRPGLPGALYFRLLARDAAGNVGSAQTPQPVLIDLKRPTVRGLRVQAVSANRALGGY